MGGPPYQPTPSHQAQLQSPSGEAHPQGLSAPKGWHGAGATKNPGPGGVFSVVSPGCWGENEAHRPFGFLSSWKNVTILWSGGLLRSSGQVFL